LLFIILIVALASCGGPSYYERPVYEDRYYRRHQYHSYHYYQHQPYYNNYYRRPRAGVNVTIHN
jgi:hypothetical protein